MDKKQKRQKRDVFISWINETGVYEVADLLGIRAATVFYWRQGKSMPKVSMMRAIRTLSKGVVSYEAIIDRPTTTR
jgi:hypothetical protein